MQNSLQTFVVGLLTEKLSPYYYYHNTEHTLYVQEKAIEIGKQEDCSANELDLLKIAALWHDAGYINTYIRHEEESCILARKHLPAYGYSNIAIESVCGMIMATKIPQSPENKLEEIIADADLEYLAGPSAVTLAENLFRELQYQNPSLNQAQWLKTQIAFLDSHRYFTAYCKASKEPQKQAYLRSLQAASR
jgi:uncharacterized protein